MVWDARVKWANIYKSRSHNDHHKLVLHTNNLVLGKEVIFMQGLRKYKKHTKSEFVSQSSTPSIGLGQNTKARYEGKYLVDWNGQHYGYFRHPAGKVIFLLHKQRSGKSCGFSIEYASWSFGLARFMLIGILLATRILNFQEFLRITR